MNENPDGTLAGLIADLEELPSPEGIFGDLYEWYAEVVNLVRKHKRAQYYIQTDGFYRNDEDIPDEEPSQVFLNQNIHNIPEWFFAGTYAECEAWIDRQVNGE